MAHPDHLLSSYRFELPEERIAQEPAARRDESRLLVLEREKEAVRTASFSAIAEYLPEKSLLVANNSRVVPARLTGARSGGGKAELLLLTPPPLLEPRLVTGESGYEGWQGADVQALLRPAKKLRPGDRVVFSGELAAKVLEREEFGRALVRLFWRGELLERLAELGRLPLPPYIKRGDASDSSVGALDAERYQTSYARADKAGSVAAPTAGLHFTPQLRERLASAGHEWAEVTLYVGYGTFSPVRCEDITAHAMHAEYVELPENAAAAIVRAKQEGRPVVAVGTTSCRVLEGVFAMQAAQERRQESEPFRLLPYAGWINIFLYPGAPFHVTDALITNFHLPESSLLMLVSAFAGRKRVLAAYGKALDAGFRFFSYGDAMLIR